MVDDDDDRELENLLYGNKEEVKKTIPVGRGGNGNKKATNNKKSKVIQDDESDEEYVSTNLDDGRKYKF